MNDLSEFVTLSDATLTTDSKRVARHFGKQHHHVVQKIESLKCSARFLTRNFSRVNFEHKGNVYHGYELTKDGFVMLVMGFSGEKAMQVKEAYISAFNAMAEQLQQNSLSLWGQRLALETKDATSFTRASLGSKLMHERKKELPSIKGERARLDGEMQPELTLVGAA